MVYLDEWPLNGSSSSSSSSRLYFLQILFLFLYIKQDCYPDHCDSSSGMTVLEGDTDVSSTNEENLCEVNKKTDEITGYL